MLPFLVNLENLITNRLRKCFELKSLATCKDLSFKYLYIRRHILLRSILPYAFSDFFFFFKLPGVKQTTTPKESCIVHSNSVVRWDLCRILNCKKCRNIAGCSYKNKCISGKDSFIFAGHS